MQLEKAHGRHMRTVELDFRKKQSHKKTAPRRVPLGGHSTSETIRGPKEQKISDSVVFDVDPALLCVHVHQPVLSLFIFFNS